MKKNYLVNQLIAAFILFSGTANATVHMVDVADFSFTRANMDVIVGDTIQWMWVSGTHTTTSTSVPQGAASWNSNINSANFFFNYQVTVAGSYSYHCSIHPTLMMGTFTATNPAGIQEVSTEPSFTWSISEGEITIRVNLNSVSDLNIRLYNMLGGNVKTLGSMQNVVGNYKETFSVNDIPKGIYFLEVVADYKKMVKKIMVE